MIFDVIILLSCLFFALSLFTLAFIAGYAAGTREGVNRRKRKNDGWESILNYNHRREEESE